MTLGSHQTTVGRTQVHITPPWIPEVLGPLELDPAAADPRPFDCAARNYTERDDGLAQVWHGRVWLNPPFDRYRVGRWIQRLAEHGCGTTLLHARTEAEWFEPIWAHASAILFMADRIKFCRPDGTEQPANSGAPPILASFGDYDRERLGSSDRLAMDAGLSILQRTAAGDHPGKFGFRQVIRAACTMTTIYDPRGQVLRIRQTATAWPHVLGAREADAMVDRILNYAIATLRRDQRITQLPLELLFVETRARATEEPVKQIAGKAVLCVAVDCIADAILVSRIMIEAIVTLVMSSTAAQISERRSRRS